MYGTARLAFGQNRTKANFIKSVEFFLCISKNIPKHST